jgi:hypothetical protein
MTEAHWTFSVRDRHGRTRRGRVVYSDRPDAAAQGPGGLAEFLILMLDEAAEAGEVADATAVCVPKPQKLHALRDAEANKLPSRLQDFTLRPHRMTEYAEGHIALPAGVEIDPADVFPVHSEHPRLDRLALALLVAADAEAMAPYTAIIRHELDLRPGVDVASALAERLTPTDANERLPARAPALARLANVTKSMRQGLTPGVTLEQLTEDLRFLRLFDSTPQRWPSEALGRLLGEVKASGRPRSKSGGAQKPEWPAKKVLPFRPAAPPDEPAGDA